MHALTARTGRSTAAVTLSSLAVAGAILGCPAASWSADGPAVTVRVSINSAEDERFKDSDSPDHLQHWPLRGVHVLCAAGAG